MDEDVYIDILNEFGVITSALLARKYKVTPRGARKILCKIVEVSENVLFKTPDQIYEEAMAAANKPKYN